MADVPEWTEGVCGDGAAFLRDGEMIRIEGRLWWMSDGSMYVYYTLTHWAPMASSK